MAKKGKSYKLDEYGFDSDFDTPDFNFEPTPVKDDRKPVTKLAAHSVAGFKSSLKDPNLVAKVIKKSIPKGYGDAIDLGDKTVGVMKNLYNDAAKEIKPALNDLKRTTDKLMPTAQNYLPKSVAARLAKWAKTADNPGQSQMDQDQMRDAMIHSQLTDMFSTTAELSARQHAETQAGDRIREAVTQSRHRDMIGQLDAIRIATEQKLAYDTKIGSAVQRKSLELQMRQYFKTTDLLNEQRVSNARLIELMASTAKNTGLPDFVKLNASERLHEMMRNKLLDQLGAGSFLGKRRDFVKNVMQNFAKTATGKIADGVSSFRNAMSSIEMMQDMTDGMGVDKYQLGGSIVGGSAAEWLGNKLGKNLRGRLEKNNRVMRGANKSQYFVENLPQLARDWALKDDDVFGFDDTKKTGVGKVGGFLNRMAKAVLSDSILGATGNNSKVNMDSRSGLEKPGLYTQLANKSITQIIPGYLARIYQELQTIRTGKNAELMTYDHSTNSFGTRSGARTNALNSLFQKADIENTKYQLNDLVSRVDPNKKLTDEQRMILGKKLMLDNFKGLTPNPHRLTDPGSYTGDAAKHANAFSDIFRQHFSDDADFSKGRQFSSYYNNLGSRAPDIMSTIQTMVNSGEADYLIEAGILDANGSVNMERALSIFAGDSFDPNSGGPKQHTLNGRPVEIRIKKHIPSFKHASSMAAPVSGNETRPIRPVVMAETQSSKAKTEELIKAIQEASSKVSSERTAEILARMEAQGQGMVELLGAILANGGSGGGGGSESHQRWYQKTVGNILGNMTNAAKNGVKGTFRFAAGMSRRLNSFIPSFSTVGKLAGTALSGVGKIGEVAAAAFGKLNDVYVKGEVEPRLLAWKLKAGKYRDQATGKIISSYKDIKGAVIDEDGNVILGIGDVKNAFVKSGAGQKLLSAVGSVLKLPSQALSFVTGGLPSVISGVVKTASKLTGISLRAPCDVYVVGKNYPALLARTMKAGGYRSRITGKVIKWAGDIDGPVLDDEDNIVLTQDELAQGLKDQHGQPLKIGVQKIIQGVKNLASLAVQTVVGGARLLKEGLAGGWGAAKQFFGGFIGRDGILFSGGKKMVSLLTEIRDILKAKLGGGNSLIDDAEHFAEGAGYGDGKSRPGEKKPMPKGIWNKTKHIGGKIAGLGGRVLSGIAGIAGLGGLAGMAGGALSGAGAVATTVAGAAGTALGWVGAGVGAAAAGLGAILSAPVVLAGLAVAAVGAAGYFGYKYFTKKKLTTLSKIRYAQYGFLPTDSTHVQAVFQLEDKILPAVVWNEGKPDFDDKKINFKEAFNLFGVDGSNADVTRNWTVWFARRFRPVFLSHLAALRSIDPKKDLSDIEDLEVTQKKKYVELTKFPDGPYDIGVSPFGGALAAGRREVENVIAEAVNELAKAKDSKQTTGEQQAVTTKTASAMSTLGKAASGATDGLSKPSPGVLGVIAGASVGAMLSLTSQPVHVGRRAGGKMDAMTAIRFKTYGLMQMDIDKVQALDALETEVTKNLRYIGKDQVNFNGDMHQVLSNVGSSFGIRGVSNNAAYDWYSWFQLRFLPTFLAYASAIKKLTGKDKLDAGTDALKGSQMLEVAMATYTAKSSSSSVWEVKFTPWPDYVLNTDASSIDQNVEALRQEAKQVTLDEEKATKQSQAAKEAAQQAMAQSANSTNKDSSSEKPSFFQRLFGTSTDANSKPQAGFFARLAASGESQDGGVAQPGAMTGGGSTGNVITQPGKGTGGDINSIPVPKGDGSYQALKPTLDASAKVVGVDPKLLATMTAIESGFKINAKAGTSSATGLLQFTAGTWKTMMDKYASKYGIDPSTPPTDPRANALMGAEFLKGNLASLQGVVKRPLTDTDVYLAHFLGAGGAKQFLSADQSKIAADVMPAAARANPSIFYRNGKALTFGEIYQHFSQLLNSRAKSYGIEAGSAGGDTKPAGTDAGAQSAGSGSAAGAVKSGTFPVTDMGVNAAQSGGAGGAISGPSSTASSSPASSTPDSGAVDSGAMALGAGFGGSSQRVANANIQNDSQMAASNFSLNPLMDATQKHADLTAAGNNYLSQILEVLKNRGMDSGSGQGGDKPTATSGTPDPETRVQRPMPEPPVLMGKRPV